MGTPDFGYDADCAGHTILNYYIDREEPSSPARAPGTRQSLLTIFLRVPVCIKKGSAHHDVICADAP